MTRDHDLGMHGDGHHKPPPPQGDNVLRSPATERIGADARSRVLVVAPQPFYGDRGTPIALLLRRPTRGPAVPEKQWLSIENFPTMMARILTIMRGRFNE